MTDPFKMNKLPYFAPAAKEGRINCLDLSPYLRQKLRYFLELDVFVRKSSTCKSMLRVYGSFFEEVLAAETLMMKIHASILTQKKEGTGDDISILEDLPVELAEKFNLFIVGDIIKATYGKAITYKDDPADEKICPHLHELRDAPLGAVYGQTTIKSKKIYTPMKRNLDVVFDVRPQEIVFLNCRLGGTYKVAVQIQNKSTISGEYNVFMGSGEDFRMIAPSRTMVAPGLSVHVMIYFRCEDRDEHYDQLTIRMVRGRKIVVPISAVRSPPQLKSYTYLCKHFGDLNMRELSTSKTIECGHVFVGGIKHCEVPVVNMGSEARFFILSETSWENASIKDTTGEAILILEPFFIEPALFFLTTGDGLTLTVIFNPECEGTHVNKVWVLCDNMTMRSIDILGEALMFDADQVVLQDVEKSYNIDEEDDMSAQYFIHFGSVFQRGHCEKGFSITNTGLVPINYQWSLRKAKIRDVFHLPVQTLYISPDSGIICPNETINFVVTYDTMNYPLGKYMVVLRFIVECLPKMSIPEKLQHIKPVKENEYYVAICIADVELHLEIEQPKVYVWPNYLSYRLRAQVFEQATLMLTNYSHMEITFRWITSDWENVIITPNPQQTRLPGLSSCYIHVGIKGLRKGHFSCLLRAVIENGLTCVQVKIEGTIESGLTLSKWEILDNGMVCKNDNRITGITAVSECPYALDIDYREYTVSCSEQDGNNVFLVPKYASCLEPGYPTILYYHAPVRIFYRVETEVAGINGSVIEWYLEGELSYTNLLADVHEVDVSLSRNRFEMVEPMYSGLEVNLSVKIRNHTLLPTSFEWKEPLGLEMDSCNITICPYRGFLEPGEHVEIQMVLTPQTPVVLDSFYIACVVEHMRLPLFLSIVGEIKDCAVTFDWNTKEKRFFIHWPEINHAPLNVSKEDTPASMLGGIQNEAQRDMQEQCFLCYNENFSDIDLPSFSSSQRAELEIMGYVDSTTSSVPYENWPYIGGKYYGATINDEYLRGTFENPWMCDDLKNGTIYPFSIQEMPHSVHTLTSTALIFKVNVDEAMTQSFIITNLAPIKVNFTAEIGLFKHKTNYESSVLSRASQLLQDDSDFLQEEQVKRLLNSATQDNYGVVIVLSETKGWIEAHSTRTLNVTVYASVWGLYFDNVIVQVCDLPLFHLPVFVQVTGFPAYFLFAPKKINPTLRFIALSHNQSATQQVFLYNSTYIPLRVAWTVYVRPLEIQSTVGLPYVEPPHFGLHFELHPSKPEDFCKVDLIDYYGEQESISYYMDPALVYLPPYSKVPVKITVDARRCWFDIKHLSTKLEATALGIVYIDEEYEGYEEIINCYRPHGTDLPLLKLKLETKIQISTLRLLNKTLSDAIFNVRTTDIFFNYNHTYSEKRLFLFENFGLSRGSYEFSVDSPFEIVSLKQKGLGILPSSRVVHLGPKETVEVELLLTLTIDFFIQSDEGYSKLRIDHEVPIFRKFVFIQKDYSEQFITLQINLKTVEFNISRERLVFGPVFIGDTKTLTFFIKTAHEEPYLIEFEKKDVTAFFVTKQRGFLKRNIENKLTVNFTPSDPVGYLNTLWIRTGSPDREYHIIAEGVGTFDYKYHIE